MKTIKYFLSVILLVAAVWSCTEDDFGSLEFVSNAVAPTNIDAQFEPATDNSGDVSITPSADAAQSYEVYYGDGTAEPAILKQGEKTSHTYAEGSYEVRVVAVGLTGLKSEVTKTLVVSFLPPVITTPVEDIIWNDEVTSKLVNVMLNADYGISYDVYFGELGNDDPVSGNVGDAVSYQYAEPGTYTIRIVVKGTGIETTEYTVDFDVTEIVVPIEAAPKPPARMDIDVISVFSDAYTNIYISEWNPGWGQSTTLTAFDVDGDNILRYDYLNYTGIVTDYGNPTNMSAMEYVHFDYWTNDATSVGFKIVNTNQPDGPLKESIVNVDVDTFEEWVSVDIPITDYTTDMSEITQMLFESVGKTVFIDNLYFWRKPVVSSPLEGTWRFAPEDGAMGVGPSVGDYSWWSSSIGDVTTRACLFDDDYVISADGTFTNVMGTETWLEPWQGVTPEACGAPIAPHDGSNPATWSSSETQITIMGEGAFLGLSKVHNGGEDGNPANNAITYDYILSPDGNSLELIIPIPWGAWHFKLVKQ